MLIPLLAPTQAMSPRAERRSTIRAATRRISPALLRPLPRRRSLVPTPTNSLFISPIASLILCPPSPRRLPMPSLSLPRTPQPLLSLPPRLPPTLPCLCSFPFSPLPPPSGLDPLSTAPVSSDPALNLIRAQLARLESKVGPSDSDLPPYISPFTIFQYTPDPNPKRIAPCSVPVFKRGVGTYFDAFLYSMEIHFIGTSAPAQMRVPLLISRIDPSHHAEMQLLQHLPYEEFTLRLRRAFREPNLSHACLSELSVASQEKDETFVQFLERLRTLARRAFPTADAITLDYTVACHFLRGMADTKIARLLWGTGLDSNGLVQRATTIATGLRNRSERKKGTAARDHLFMLGSAEPTSHSARRAPLATASPASPANPLLTRPAKTRLSALRRCPRSH